MRFFQIVASGAAFIAAALALEINQFPAGGVKAGQTYTITYSPASDTPTTFILRKGLSTNLDTVGTLTTTATGGTYSWTVSKDLVNGDNYALEIQQKGQAPNYSAQFGLTGGETASVSSAISSIVSSVRSSASASASASASSASASLSSLISSIASSAAASATASASAGLNSTVSSATLSRSTGSTKPTSSATSTSSISPPESTGAASMLSSSPLALLFGAIGAFAFLN
jgi:hypothetical protein